jgi:hypothetical protein
MSETEVNKYLTERMAVKHKWITDTISPMGEYGHCECGWDGCSTDYKIHYHHNPDYHNAKGRQTLLEWTIEQKWWRDFVLSQGWGIIEEGNIQLRLLIPVDQLAKEVCKYLKGKEVKVIPTKPDRVCQNCQGNYLLCRCSKPEWK